MILDRMLRKRTPRPAAAVPEGTRVYAIGDVHGRADLLRVLHAGMRADADAHPASRRVAVYLGDYVDRGLDSRGVIDAVLGDELAGFERVALKGNHEDLMLRFLEDTGIAPSWFHNGGIATLFSYGISSRAENGEPHTGLVLQGALRERLPARHLQFLRELRLTHREGDYLFVHAGIRPGVPVADQVEEDLIWIREPFTGSRADHGFVVVHGHTITPSVETADNRVGIDTGAYFSGTLTCLVLQGTGRSLIQTGDKWVPGTGA